MDYKAQFVIEARSLVAKGMSRSNALKEAVKYLKLAFNVVWKVLLGTKSGGPASTGPPLVGPSGV